MLTIARRVGGSTLGDAIWLVHLTLTAIPIWFTCDLLWLHPFKAGAIGLIWWEAHGSEHFWAAWCLLVSLIGCAGLVSKSGDVRLASATVLGVAHGIIATGMHLGNPVGSATGTYAIIMGLAACRIWLERNRADA